MDKSRWIHIFGTICCIGLSVASVEGNTTPPMNISERIFEASVCVGTSNGTSDGNVTSVQCCVSNCTNLIDGNYQSCLGCDVYATCSQGLLTDKHPCEQELLWDDIKKSCGNSSATCNLG